MNIAVINIRMLSSRRAGHDISLALSELAIARCTQLQKGFIDMENMFQLLGRRSAVRDLRDAKPLTVSQGQRSPHAHH